MVALMLSALTQQIIIMIRRVRVNLRVRKLGRARSWWHYIGGSSRDKRTMVHQQFARTRLVEDKLWPAVEKLCVGRSPSRQQPLFVGRTSGRD